jgi:hypothetical protein
MLDLTPFDSIFWRLPSFVFFYYLRRFVPDLQARESASGALGVAVVYYGGGCAFI